MDLNRSTSLKEVKGEKPPTWTFIQVGGLNFLQFILTQERTVLKAFPTILLMNGI